MDDRSFSHGGFLLQCIRGYTSLMEFLCFILSSGILISISPFSIDSNRIVGKLIAAADFRDHMEKLMELACGEDLRSILKEQSATTYLQSMICMQQEGFRPDVVTIVSLVPACTKLRALKQGKEIHGFALKNNMLSVPLTSGKDNELKFLDA
ncbi:Pentatricopeptide repeat-containing protein [Drosera capensis]